MPPVLSSARFACLALGLLIGFAAAATAPDPARLWDNKCEQCHGDYIEFSQKYLWNVNNQLQGIHHIDDLSLFMKHHYLPAYGAEVVNNLLLSHANSPARFDAECSRCHGELASFLQESIWVRGESMTAMKTGMEVSEFLPTHEGLGTEDVEFYVKLFTRYAR